MEMRTKETLALGIEKKMEGGVYDELVDRGRKGCSRFGNGNDEELTLTLLGKEDDISQMSRRTSFYPS
jgi:hypothetical protein